jgi:serine-type D-Ala-D-Ala carboxypeptidase/endopeptidase (penicillin-binding protein 4)
VALAALALAPVAAGAGGGGPAALRATLAGWTRTHTHTSALVWRLDPEGPVPILASRPDVARMPASTMKLITSAGALLALGPDFRFETRLYAGPHTRRHGRVLVGPVYLKGYGDPSLSTPAFARVALGGRGGNLGQLAGALHRQGIRLVRGPIVADESFFDSQRTGPLWKASYTGECPPLSALVVNRDTAGTPPVPGARDLRALMKVVRVRQTGGLRSGRAPTTGRVLGTVKSPPLSAILAWMNPNSDNFFAETLAKDVGAYVRGVGSTRAGTAVTGRLLRERGILGPNDRLVDGSGLSRENRVTPSTQVRLLAAAVAEPSWGRALIDSLEHGASGTLRHRLLTPGIGRRVRAKTGYINGVSALAGIVRSPSGERFAFSFLMNEWDIAGAHAVQDRLVTLLAEGAGDRAPVLQSAGG